MYLIFIKRLAMIGDDVSFIAHHFRNIKERRFQCSSSRSDESRLCVFEQIVGLAENYFSHQDH